MTSSLKTTTVKVPKAKVGPNGPSPQNLQAAPKSATTSSPQGVLNTTMNFSIDARNGATPQESKTVKTTTKKRINGTSTVKPKNANSVKANISTLKAQTTSAKAAPTTKASNKKS